MLKKREKKTGKSGRKITVCSRRLNDVLLTKRVAIVKGSKNPKPLVA